MRHSPDEVRVMLKDAIVRRRAGLPPAHDDETMLDLAMGAIEHLQHREPSYCGRCDCRCCDCDCHDED